MTETEAKKLLLQAIDLYQQGELDKVIDILCKIQREDSPELYAKAQFILGSALGERGDTEGEIIAYRNVTHEDSPEYYAIAQFYLGATLGELGNTEGALTAYRNVTRKDSSEHYAMAQFNLGTMLGMQGDLKGAFATWRNITREDSSEQYAKAQLNLGVVLGKQGDREGEFFAYHNITREDSPENYAKAQINIGIALGEQGDLKGAIAAYSKILRKDSKSLYAKAQFNIGILLEKQGDIEKAIATWKNVRREDLGILHEYNYYETESCLKPLSHKNLTVSLLKIRQTVATLIRNLLVKKDSQNTKKPKVAHYSSPEATYAILAKNSLLRLTSAKGVNDPSEGLVLYQYIYNYCKLKINTQPLILSTDTSNQSTSVFIGCFTFNHDSLNQFRLYGKEEGREASGISVVIDQRFFSDENLFGIMSASVNSPIKENLADLDKKFVSDKKHKLSKQQKNKSLENLPLYRCLYLDPNSGYLSIAQRDKATFFAETWYEDKTADYKTICEQAEKDWDSYFEEISKLIKIIKNEFTQLADAVAEILKESPGNDVLDTLVFVLQPLRYLVKHTAFQEEQECRMIYITSLEDTRIKSEWDNKRMYLEYAAPVKDALDKIYLSPGAQPHEDFFKKELPHLAKTGKIRHSQNPFRNK